MMKKYSVLLLILVLELGIGVALAATKTIVYKCPTCNKVEEYADAAFTTHYCSGTKESPHAKAQMVKIREKKD
jgi:hypothetical protein